jgi:hypothetical protein
MRFDAIAIDGWYRINKLREVKALSAAIAIGSGGLFWAEGPISVDENQTRIGRTFWRRKRRARIAILRSPCDTV